MEMKYVVPDMAQLQRSVCEEGISIIQVQNFLNIFNLH